MKDNTNNSVSVLTGMRRDMTPLKQKDNTYRFALNSVLDTDKGSLLSISNERGNTLIDSVQSGHTIIGSITLGNADHVIFSTDDTSSNIYRFTDNTLLPLLINVDLGFSTDHRISGEHRIINGCDNIIYFRDSLNPDRRINLSKIDDGFYNDLNGNFDSTLTELNPDYTVPNMQTSASSGGDLEPGSYQFSIAYLDNEFNVVYRSYLSLPEYVIDNVHSSVSCTFQNIDTSFTYANIYCTIGTAGDGYTTVSYEVKRNHLIQSSQFTYTLFNITSDMITVTLDELTQKNVIYETSRTMEQVNNRLIRANLTEKNRDYKIYQPYANSVTVNWVSKVVPADSREQSFMGGEVEAFGIVYVHTDGSESPAFHIPCRTSYSKLTISSPYHQRGTCDSKECTSTLYTAPSCAEDIWSVHNTATSLENTTVKHFLTPDRDVINFGGSTLKRVIGYEFSTISYPPDVIGHYIVKAKRDESNKIIVSKGFAAPLNSVTTTGGVNYRGLTYLQAQNTPGTLTSSHLYFISPDLLYKRKSIEGNEFTKIYEFRTTETNVVTPYNAFGEDVTGKGDGNCQFFDGQGSALFDLGANGDLDVRLTVSYLEAGAVRFDANRQYSAIAKTKFFEYLQSNSLLCI